MLTEFEYKELKITEKEFIKFFTDTTLNVYKYTTPGGDIINANYYKGRIGITIEYCINQDMVTIETFFENDNDTVFSFHRQLDCVSNAHEEIKQFLIEYKLSN